MNTLRNNRNKLLAPLVVTVGLGSAACSASEDNTPDNLGSDKVVPYCATATIGGRETGFTQGAVDRAIEDARIAAAHEMNSVGEQSTVEIARAIPRYNDSRDIATEIGKEIPDSGDKVEVCVDMSGKDLPVVESHYIDLPNNQDQ